MGFMVLRPPNDKGRPSSTAVQSIQQEDGSLPFTVIEIGFDTIMIMLPVTCNKLAQSVALLITRHKVFN